MARCDSPMRRTRLPALLILALAGASCSSVGEIDGPVLSSPDPPLFGGGGWDAIVSGTVIFHEASGCLLFAYESWGYPIVWPAGATWDPETPAVRLPGQLIEMGTRVTGSGGYLSRETVAAEAGEEVAAAAAACAGPGGDIAFFNRGSEVRFAVDE